jgi:hypothetical protein
MNNDIRKNVEEKIKKRNKQEKKENVSLTLAKWIIIDMKKECKRLDTNLSFLIESILFDYLNLPPVYV